MENCVFCERKLNKGDVIYESQNFFINIGIGIAAPGHIMLIPKEHFDCCGVMPQRLHHEFKYLKELAYGKVKEIFFEPFMVEYGIFEQSVPHAHLHFIPKERKETQYYAGYKLDNIFREMKIPAGISKNASWENAKLAREKSGGYIYLEDGKACLFSKFSKDFTSKDLSYRNFFNKKLGLKDIPDSWKNITYDAKEIDEIKRKETKERLRF